MFMLIQFMVRVAWREDSAEPVSVPILHGCKLKILLAAAKGPWLLILIQSLSLQEPQERPLDSSDLKKQRHIMLSQC